MVLFTWGKLPRKYHDIWIMMQMNIIMVLYIRKYRSIIKSDPEKGLLRIEEVKEVGLSAIICLLECLNILGITNKPD